MTKAKKAVVWSAVVLIAVVIAYFLVVRHSGNAAPGGTSEPASPAASAAPTQPAGKEAMPLPVKAVAARRGDIIIGLKSPGEAYTERRVTVKAEVGSIITKLEAREGLHAAAGLVLAELDDREIRLNLHKLEALRLRALSEVLLEKMYGAPASSAASDPAVLARVEKARKDFESADERYRKGRAGQEEWDGARRAYEFALIESGGRKDEIMSSTKNLTQTETDVKMAELELERTIVKAPFAGVITDIKVSPGEHVSAGQELFTLVDISRLKVKASVLESEIGKMKAGREVDIRFPAYPDRVFKGMVEAVSPVVNPEDRTCGVYISVLNPGEEVKPGMHAEVEIAAEVHPNVLIVPQEAILVRSGRKLVFVIEDGLAKWRYVQTGVENDRFAEVIDGVKEGEMVITEGHFTLAHDARVSVVR